MIGSAKAHRPRRRPSAPVALVPQPRSEPPFVVDADPALDDGPLREARQAAVMGAWEDAEALLADTGRDHDRRAHRVAVLAAASRGQQWAQAWAVAEPESPHAYAVLAHAAVLECLRSPGVATFRRALRLFEEAVTRDPLDPVPHLARLSMARIEVPPAPRDRAEPELTAEHVLNPETWRPAQIATPADFDGWDLSHEPGWTPFDAALALDPASWEAHHLMLEALSPRLGPRAPGTEWHMIDFARRAAAQVPVSSPLRLLPLWAHLEMSRAREEDGVLRSALHEWQMWREPPVFEDLKRALAWWDAPSRQHAPPYAKRVADLNVLAYALYATGRWAPAVQVFEAIGPYMTAPWREVEIAGERGEAAFGKARRATLTHAAEES
jgi:hypothetical protein